MRILLADNQSKVRFALRALLEQQPGLTVVSEAINAEELLLHTEAAAPDLILLDWGLQNHTSIDLLPTLRRIRPNLSVIALSGRPEVRQVALAAGVDAFVSKTEWPDRLLTAIKECRHQGLT